MKVRKLRIIVFLILIGAILGIYYAYSYNLPKWFPFNKENALKEWEEKIFKNKVLYRIEAKREGGYLSAKSKRACSGLLYKLKFYPQKLPMISWKWRVIKFPETGELSNKGGWIEKDDYAARLYVIFPSWYFMHMQSIEYVWAKDLPEDTIMTSPYFNNIKIIIAESGKKNKGEWTYEERNIYEDYKKAFGRYPTNYVGAIALMTDTDNTLSTAEAFYKDIKVGYKDE